MKKVFVLGITVLVLLVSLTGCGNTIDLPDADVVTRIEIGSHTVTNDDDITTIMSAILGGRRVSRNAMNEQPFGQNLLNIYLYMIVDGEEVMCHRLYLYTDDGNDRLWNSYVGIYGISQENSNKLRQLYTDTLSDNPPDTQGGNESAEVEEDIGDEAMPLHIVGTWTFAKAELEDGTEFEHWESLVDLEIEIRLDGAIRYVDKGTILHSGREDVVEGIWIQIGEFDFEFTSKTNICLCCGEYVTEPVDSYLRYDPITGLLEHFGHSYAEPYYAPVRIHVFFERVH